MTFDPTPGRLAGALAADRHAGGAGRAAARATGGARRRRPRVGPDGPAARPRRRRRPAASRRPAIAARRARSRRCARRRRPAGASRRRRRLARSGDPELEELRWRCARTGRPLAPDTDARPPRALLGGSDGALGYLRALRLARYGRGGPPPTAAQRRALRRELGRRARPARAGLRALWALPPRSARAARRVEAAPQPVLHWMRHGEPGRLRALPPAGRSCWSAATATPRPSRSARARDLEPGQGLGPRGLRPRAVRRRSATREAAEEFGAVVEHAPTNDYALFCLGRSLQLLGRHDEARHPLALAALPAARSARTTAATATRPAAARPEAPQRLAAARTSSAALDQQRPAAGRAPARRPPAIAGMLAAATRIVAGARCRRSARATSQPVAVQQRVGVGRPGRSHLRLGAQQPVAQRAARRRAAAADVLDDEAPLAGGDRPEAAPEAPCRYAVTACDGARAPEAFMVLSSPAQLSCRRATAGDVQGVGAEPALSFERGGLMSTTSRPRSKASSPSASPRSRCCSRSSAATPSRSSSTIPTA